MVPIWLVPYFVAMMAVWVIFLIWLLRMTTGGKGLAASW
jgi:hypothetical protein